MKANGDTGQPLPAIGRSQALLLGAGDGGASQQQQLETVLLQRGLEVLKFPRSGGTPEPRVISLDATNAELYWVGAGGKRNCLSLRDVTSIDVPECNPDGKSIRAESRVIRRYGDPAKVDSYVSLLTARGDSKRDQLDIQLTDASPRDLLVQLLRERVRSIRSAPTSPSPSSSAAISGQAI